MLDRFAQYLHKLTKNTQFIVITHRRGTMTAADRLYGITMQEKGVSHPGIRESDRGRISTNSRRNGVHYGRGKERLLGTSGRGPQQDER